jgi:DNA repair protein RadC
MSIRDWPENQRPREKLLKYGAYKLTDAELLAVFLRTGVKGKSAVELGNDVLKHFGSLHRLFSAPQDIFSQLHGLGPAKYAQLQAVFELARRTLDENLQKGLKLNSPNNVKNFLQLLIGNKTYESFVILFLDVKHRLLDCEELFRGSLVSAQIYPREIIKRTLHHNAAAVILAHNHPAGQPEPSQADITLTAELKKILATVEAKVLDHFIVADNNIFSFCERGLL